MTIKDWPASEKPREKLLQKGAHILSDAELLAIFLQTGVAGKTAVDISRDILTRFGGIRQVLNIPLNQLNTERGIGPAKYVLLQASLELGKRYLNERLQKQDALTCPEQVMEYFCRQLRDRQQEIFSVIFLNSRHQVLYYEELFFGTINGATVHPREVVKSVLFRNAAAVIIAHNHPSGIAEPSNSDTLITAKIKNALALIDVPLLDHLIIGDGEYVSMSERGLM